MRTTHDQRMETGEVHAWRRAQLKAAGFPPALAARLAADPRFDLHALIELTERSCAPELAVRILAPLDSEDEAA